MRQLRRGGYCGIFWWAPNAQPRSPIEPNGSYPLKCGPVGIHYGFQYGFVDSDRIQSVFCPADMASRMLNGGFERVKEVVFVSQ